MTLSARISAAAMDEVMPIRESCGNIEVRSRRTVFSDVGYAVQAHAVLRCPRVFGRELREVLFHKLFNGSKAAALFARSVIPAADSRKFYNF